MTEEVQQQNVGSVKTLAIFTYIGSAFWGIFGLLFLVAGGWIGALLAGGSSMKNEFKREMVSRGADTSQLDAAASEAGGILAMGTGIFMGIGALIILLAVLRMVGAAKMSKGNKKGFMLYTIGTAIFAILCFLGMTMGSIISGLILVLFIFLYSRNLKYLS